MNTATSSRASSRSSGSRSPNGTSEKPGRSGLNRSVNAASPDADSDPSVSPSKPIVRSTCTICGSIACAWRPSTSAPRPSTKSLSQPTPELSPRADEHASGNDQRGAEEDVPADELAAPQQQRREEDAPERLGRDERADHRHASAVVRLEERRVRETEQHAGRDEGPRRGAEASRPGPAPRDEQVGADRGRAREQRDGRRHERLRIGVLGEPAQEVVADREDDGGGEREEDAEATEVRRPHPFTRQGDTAGDDQHGADEKQRPNGLVQ